MSEIVVVGAGTMGHGIAQVAAQAGYSVALVDTEQTYVERGLERITANLEQGVQRGKVDAATRDAALARIRGSTRVADATDAALLCIEAVPERAELKAEVLAQLEAAAPADALLASNTSSLSITELQHALTRAERMLGLHFFNPVHINPLVEVVRGGSTGEAALTRALEFVARIGKEPVVVNDSPGFATSRLGVLLGLEAMRMVEQGVAGAADIDRAMELGYRHPMGPLRLTDLVGLDVRLDIARYLFEKLGEPQFRPPRILEQMVAEGRLGKKSGRGFYEWGQD